MNLANKKGKFKIRGHVFQIPLLHLFLTVLIVSSFLIGYASKTLSEEIWKQRHLYTLGNISNLAAHVRQDLISQSPGEQTLYKVYQCQSVVKPRESRVVYTETGQYWQKLVPSKHKTYVFRAYYDNRRTAEDSAFVRILGTSTCKPGEGDKCRFFCQVWFKEDNVTIITAEQFRINKKYRLVDGITMFGQYMFSCPVRGNHSIPTQVSMVENACDISTILLPVRVPETGKNITFGVCVSIGYGYLQPQHLIEWFEFYKFMGVKEFNIYNATLSPDLRNIFDYYIKSSVLKVTQMPAPENPTAFEAIKTCEVVSVNDCLYRNMFNYQYIISIDFDEFIIPKHASNFNGMMRIILRAVRTPHNVVSYTFKNQYHFLNFAEDTTKPVYLRTLRFPRFIPGFTGSSKDKSFVRPRLCQSLYNHYCLRPIPAVLSENGFQQAVTISKTIAANQHYRHCNKHCERNLKKQQYTDKYISRYEKVLNYYTLKVAQDLKLPGFDLVYRDK